MMELQPLEAGATFSPPSDPIVVNDDNHFEATPTTTTTDSTAANASGHSQTSADESMEELKLRLTSAHKKNRLLEDNAKQFQEMLSSTHELVSKYTDLVDKHNRTGLQLQQLTYENQRLKTEHQQTQQNVSQMRQKLTQVTHALMGKIKELEMTKKAMADEMDEKIKYRRERDSMESLTKQLSAEIEGGVKWITDKSFMEKEIKRLRKDLNYEKTKFEQRAKECLRLNTMLRNSKGGLEILQKEVLFLKGIFENDGRKEEIERLLKDFREKEQEREKEELDARKDEEEVEIVNITCPSEDLSEEEIDEHMLNKEIDSLMEDIETAEKDKESSCERAKEQNADDEGNKKSAGRERAKGKKKAEEKDINGRKAAEEKGKKRGRKGLRKEKEKKE